MPKVAEEFSRHRKMFVLPVCAGAMLLAAGSAHAGTPLPDPGTIVTIQTENDIFGHTDRNYTAGIRLGVMLPTGELPGVLSDLDHSIWGEGLQRLYLDISQSLFTPKDTAAVTPDPKDRPYAAVLITRLGIVHTTDLTQSVVGLGLGVLGPSAEGEQLQNGFHDLIGDPRSNGWHAQIKNMPVVQILAARTWRLPLFTVPVADLEVDAMPSVSGTAGTWLDNAQVGFQLRMGQGLDSDFGPVRMSPGLTGTDAYMPTRPFVWYVFAGADGQAIAWDSTLDGSPFRSGPHVSSVPLVGEMEVGFAIIAYGLRFSYTHVLQTAEFRGQRGGLFQFGSVAVAARF
jgi:lipid A 3-O-deacylase